ncbi:MAG: hypothetical protein M9933_08980 [Chitinophagaceae bacterium]|nr:hypothetical protein [Chitinophagaceae bacterium]
MIFKKNNLLFGLLLGLLVPALSLIVYYFFKFYPLYSLGDMFRAFHGNNRLVTAVTIPCLFVNIVIFTFYVNSHRDRSARGIFTATLLYGVAALLFKLIG